FRDPPILLLELRQSIVLQELIKHDPSVQKDVRDRSSVGAEHFPSYVALQRIRSQPVHARLPGQRILDSEPCPTGWTNCNCCHCRRILHRLLKKTPYHNGTHVTRSQVRSVGWIDREISSPRHVSVL